MARFRLTIRSGGQTGVDRAALDAALERGGGAERRRSLASGVPAFYVYAWRMIGGLLDAGGATLSADDHATGGVA